MIGGDVIDTTMLTDSMEAYVLYKTCLLAPTLLPRESLVTFDIDDGGTDNLTGNGILEQEKGSKAIDSSVEEDFDENTTGDL
jgi:hypothetical protein